MDIKFHCSEKNVFKEHHRCVRAFTYKEYSIEPHNHAFYEMNIVLGGSGVHQIEDAQFRAERGDVFVIPPMTVHAYSNTEHLEVYHVLFKKEFIQRNESESMTVPGYLKLMEIEPFLRQNGSNAMFLHLTSPQIVEIQNELNIIEDKSVFDTASLLPLHEHTVWKLIYYLSYLLEKQTADNGKSPRARYQNEILDTLEYLNSHYSEKITVNKLAERVSLSRSTFLRNFYALCGCSPTEYLNKYRTQKAIKLSQSTAISKTEIAHSCGFYDLSHMERSFKKHKV